MEQIEQLKAMRDAAKARIEALPDFRLMTSLTALIDDLEKALGIGEQSADTEDAPEAEPAGGASDATDGSAALVSAPESASAVSVLAVAIAEPIAPDVEPETVAAVTEIDPVPVQAAPAAEPEPEPEPESEPEPETEPEIEYETASPSPLVAAAEALSHLDSLPSEEAIQVLEAVEEALTADMPTQPGESGTDEYETEVRQEEPVSYVSTLGLSESEEEAVNRALAELSVDLDEDFEEPEPLLRPSVLRR